MTSESGHGVALAVAGKEPSMDTHSTAQRYNRRFALHLDPRTKLYLLAISSSLLFFHVNMTAEASITALLLIPFLASGQRRLRIRGLRMTAIYAAMLVLSFLAPVSGGLLSSYFVMFIVGLRTLYPCVVAGAYTFSSTTNGEMICALRRMRCPESVLVTFMVMIRYFPTLTEDYRQIRSAMTLRGVATGRLGMLRHPAQSLEYVLIPLLMNSTEVAQDLTVATLTKGISLPGKHTSLVQVRITTLDWCYMAICTLLLATSAGGLW